MRMHPDELVVSVETVRELIAAQFPQWTDEPVERVGAVGTENAIFRVGAGLAARFPLRPSPVEEAARRLEKQDQAARELAGQTRFATPVPVAVGTPGAGYPLVWSVQTWLPGQVATEEDPGWSMAFAHDLAEFIAGVRAIPTRGRSFSGAGRGGELTDHDAWLERCFAESVTLLDVARLRRVWARLRALPRGGAVEVMCHGDLIPANVLVSDGRLAGVLDVGGLGPADPALDLVSAWHLLDDAPRQALRADLACSDLEWERGKAWAFQQAMGLVWYYLGSNLTMSRLGRRTLDRIMRDETGLHLDPLPGKDLP